MQLCNFVIDIAEKEAMNQLMPQLEELICKIADEIIEDVEEVESYYEQR